MQDRLIRATVREMSETESGGRHEAAIGRVRELWRYPVKSMAGERVESLTIGPAGVSGDRLFGVLDVSSDRILSAKREERLLAASARLLETGPVAIRLPGAVAELVDDGQGRDRELSAWLGGDVRLVRAEPGRSMEFEMEVDPDSSERFKVLETPTGNFADCADVVHVLTTGSLAWACRRLGGDAGDLRRYRPNVVVETGDGVGIPEDAWVGCDLALGGVVARVVKPTVRCVVVTRPQPDLQRRSDVLHTLAQTREACLGVYAAVRTDGVLSVGDAVALRDVRPGTPTRA